METLSHLAAISLCKELGGGDGRVGCGIILEGHGMPLGAISAHVVFVLPGACFCQLQLALFARPPEDIVVIVPAA